MVGLEGIGNVGASGERHQGCGLGMVEYGIVTFVIAKAVQTLRLGELMRHEKKNWKK